MGEQLSEKQQRARDAEWMAWERSARPASPSQQRKAKLEADYQAWSDAERWLVSVAPAWVMPAGNACAFAVEGALWVRKNMPHLTDQDVFLDAVQQYRNERLSRLGEDMADFKTEAWW